MTRQKTKKRKPKKAQPRNWVWICVFLLIGFLILMIVRTLFITNVIIEAIIALFNPATYIQNSG